MARWAQSKPSWPKNLEVVKDRLVERIPRRIVEQTVDLAVSSGDAGSSRIKANGTNSAAAAAAAKSVDEARPPEFAKYHITSESESELAESSDEDFPSDEVEAGSPWSTASGTTSRAATAAVAKSVGEVRPRQITECTATQNVNVPRDAVLVTAGHETTPPNLAVFEFRNKRIEADPQW